MARTGRRARRDRAGIGLAQPPFKRLRNPFPPFEILSADQIEAIHAASLQVLAEIGMNFLLPEACTILAEAGAAVEPAGARVRFDPAFVEERIRTAAPPTRSCSRSRRCSRWSTPTRRCSTTGRCSRA